MSLDSRERHAQTHLSELQGDAQRLDERIRVAKTAALVLAAAKRIDRAYVSVRVDVDGVAIMGDKQISELLGGGDVMARVLRCALVERSDELLYLKPPSWRAPTKKEK